MLQKGFIVAGKVVNENFVPMLKQSNGCIMLLVGKHTATRVTGSCILLQEKAKGGVIRQIGTQGGQGLVLHN